MPPFGIGHGPDRSREKQLAHDHRYRQSGPAAEQLHVGPPKGPPPEERPTAPVRLWQWVTRRWNGD